MQYFILRSTGDEADVFIDALPDGGPADWKYGKGQPLADEYPAKATVQYSDNYPNGRRLLDVVNNVSNVLMVSSRVRAVLDAQNIDNVEYLPLTVLDHRGKIAGKNYFVANVLGAQPVIDMKKSDVVISKLSGEIRVVKRLVVDKDSVDAKAKLFRAETFKRLLFIREDALEALVEGGITGMRTFPADGWDGLDV